MSRFGRSQGTTGNVAGHFEWLSPVASGVLGRGLFVVRDKNSVVAGELLKVIERFVRQAKVKR